MCKLQNQEIFLIFSQPGTRSFVLVVLLGLVTDVDRNDSFPYPFIYFNNWNQHEKGTPFGRSLPIQAIVGSTFPHRKGFESVPRVPLVSPPNDVWAWGQNLGQRNLASAQNDSSPPPHSRQHTSPRHLHARPVGSGFDRPIACVASVSVRFRSKERGTRV